MQKNFSFINNRFLQSRYA